MRKSPIPVVIEVRGVSSRILPQPYRPRTTSYAPDVLLGGRSLTNNRAAAAGNANPPQPSRRSSGMGRGKVTSLVQVRDSY